MDWYLHPPSPATAARLRRHITAYLHQHATDTSRMWAAEATIGELIGNAVDHAHRQGVLHAFLRAAGPLRCPVTAGVAAFCRQGTPAATHPLGRYTE